MIGQIIQAAAGIAGGAISGYAQYRAGQLTQELAERNARLLQIQARRAEESGAAQASQAIAQGAEVAGSAETVMGASGTDVDVGALVQTNFVAQWEASYIRANARMEAWGMRERAKNLQFEGDMAEMMANYGAAASIVGGAGQAASSLYGGISGGGQGAPGQGYNPATSFSPASGTEYSYSSIGTIR